MQIERQLERAGLAPQTRVLVGMAAAVWRAEWPDLTAWAEAAHRRNHPRGALEETLLMCVLFCGFPRVITAWEHFAAAWPVDVPPSGGALPEDQQRPAGDRLFHSIYGKNDEAVRAMLRGYHQELHDFVLESAYGRILARPGLPGVTRELIAVGVLAAQGQKRQFAGHARGAHHLGATTEQLREVLTTAFEGDESQIGEWLGRIRT